MFRSTVKTCMKVNSGKMLVFPQIKKLDIFLAATMVVWVAEIVAGAVIMLISVGFGVEAHVSNWGGLFCTLLIIPALGFGMGTLMESRIQQISMSRYIVSFQQPTLPDESLYPRPYLFTLFIFVGTPILCSILSLVWAAVREHAGF